MRSSSSAVGSAAASSVLHSGAAVSQRTAWRSMRGASALTRCSPRPACRRWTTTELVITVSALTTPLNFDMPALTVPCPAETSTVRAWTVTLPDAVTVMPLVSSLTELPFASTTSIAPGPSLSVTFWPPGVSSDRAARWPSSSSSVTLTPLRERITFFVLRPAPSIDSGGASRAVPQAAEHVRPARVAALERDEHLVVGVGDEPGAAVVAAHQRRQPRPRLVGAAAGVGRPRQRDLARGPGRRGRGGR